MEAYEEMVNERELSKIVEVNLAQILESLHEKFANFENKWGQYEQKLFAEYYYILHGHQTILAQARQIEANLSGNLIRSPSTDNLEQLEVVTPKKKRIGQTSSQSESQLI